MVRKNDITDAVDKLVGAKIKELRLAAGLSRHQLAEKIYITHQQLAKYEMAINRITVGRMAAICAALGTPIEHFMQGSTGENIIPLTQPHRLCLEVSRNLLKIGSPDQQHAIGNLVKTMANDAEVKPKRQRKKK